MSLRKEDIFDRDIVDAYELASDGYGTNSIYLQSVTVVSTTSSTKTIVINTPPDSEGLIYSADHPLEENDIVWIYGTSSGLADGYYTVNSILTDLSFSVNETINDSTGGQIQFRYRSGALNVGFDPRETSNVTHNNVQQAIEDLDRAIAGSNNLTPQEHEKLRQLIHLADGVGGPFEGFLSGAYRELTPNSLAPTNIVWYTDNTKAKKIVDKTVTYNASFSPTLIQWQVYNTDGSTVLASVTDTITYVGMFELYRIRDVVDHSISSGFLDSSNHKSLRQLIHLADGVGGPFEGFPSGLYREIQPTASPFVTSVIWYVDNTKSKKIVENNIVRNTINMPIAITWKVYDVDGVTVLSSVTDTISYTNNIFETSRTRTIT